MRVCIIGNGLTSLTLAKALVNQNIYVDIIEQNKKNLFDKSRTIGISKSNIEFFNNSIINVDKIAWGAINGENPPKINIARPRKPKEKETGKPDNNNININDNTIKIVILVITFWWLYIF